MTSDGIFVSLFLLFKSFADNQWLQYRRVGRWKDYLVGEWAYITPSLVAKSILAWQIFASTLASTRGRGGRESAQPVTSQMW